MKNIGHHLPYNISRFKVCKIYSCGLCGCSFMKRYIKMKFLAIMEKKHNTMQQMGDGHNGVYENLRQFQWIT